MTSPAASGDTQNSPTPDRFTDSEVLRFASYDEMTEYPFDLLGIACREIRDSRAEIERLRAEVAVMEREVAMTRSVAATEIERLRAEVARLEAREAAVQAHVGRLRKGRLSMGCGCRRDENDALIAADHDDDCSVAHWSAVLNILDGGVVSGTSSMRSECNCETFGPLCPQCCLAHLATPNPGAALRDAIATAHLSVYELGLGDLDADELDHELRGSAAVLAMPEMQAIRKGLQMYYIENRTDRKLALAGEYMRWDGFPESVIEWVVGP